MWNGSRNLQQVEKSSFGSDLKPVSCSQVSGLFEGMLDKLEIQGEGEHICSVKISQSCLVYGECL